MAQVSEATEKVDSERFLVAQALLPVQVLLQLTSMRSQEWLCYWTFSAATSACVVLTCTGIRQTAQTEVCATKSVLALRPDSKGKVIVTENT